MVVIRVRNWSGHTLSYGGCLWRWCDGVSWINHVCWKRGVRASPTITVKWFIQTFSFLGFFLEQSCILLPPTKLKLLFKFILATIINIYIESNPRITYPPLKIEWPRTSEGCLSLNNRWPMTNYDLYGYRGWDELMALAQKLWKLVIERIILKWPYLGVSFIVIDYGTLGFQEESPLNAVSIYTILTIIFENAVCGTGKAVRSGLVLYHMTIQITFKVRLRVTTGLTFLDWLAIHLHSKSFSSMSFALYPYRSLSGHLILIGHACTSLYYNL